jgi:hypothetical protein
MANLQVKDPMVRLGLGVGCAALSVACQRTDPPRTDPPREEAVATCPAEWLIPPAVDRAIALPDGGGRVVLHAAATGSQNYTCAQTAADGAGGYAWAFTGPEATLSDCRASVIGRHIASDAGRAAPRWETADGSFVVGRKVAAWAPDPSSIPWLLLAIDGRGGAGPLSEARYVQRVSTRGGGAPQALCDPTSAGASQKVPYTADYFFYGP